MEQDQYKRLIQLEAKVHQMEAMMQVLLNRLDIDPTEVTPPEPPKETRAIREALLAGHKIMAIKLYRELYGVSLKEGKEAVEAIENNMRR